jgi:large subunit ribosomal protein L17
MRHGKSYSRLKRTSAHRDAMFRNMATSLIRNGQIETTLAKAKQLRPVFERLITRLKKSDLSAKKAAHSYLKNESVTKYFFEKVVPLVKSRNGGYTRIVRTGYRNGDAAQLAIISLVDKQDIPSFVVAAKNSTRKKSVQKESTQMKDEKTVESN